MLSRRSLWLCNVGLVLLQNTASALPPKEIVIQNNNKHVDFFVLHGSKSIFGAQFLHVSIKNTVEGVCPGIFGAKLIPVFQYCCSADLFSVTHVIFFTIRRSQRFTTRLRLEPSPVYLPWNEHLVTICKICFKYCEICFNYYEVCFNYC